MSGRTLISFENWRVEMKRKVIALLLVAIMAFTACSALAMTTTQKVAAASANTQSKSIIIDYKPGAKYTIWGWQFTRHESYYTATVGEPKHFEMALGGTAFSWICASPTQSGNSEVLTGPSVKLNLNGADLTTIARKPCKVTWYLTYNFATKGSGYVGGYADCIGSPAWRLYVGPGGPSKLSGTTVVPFTGSIAGPGVAIFGPALTAHIVALTMSGAGPDAGQTTATLVCSKIVIEFPAS